MAGVVGRDRCLVLISAALILTSLPCTAGDGARHPVTLADLESLGFPDVTLQFSPDGRLLAYALSSDSVWLVPTRAGGRPRQIGTGFLPVWSAAGDKLAFYSLASGSVQLWVYDLRLDRSEQVTHVEGGIDPDPATRIVGWVHDAFRYSFSPDGSRITFATRAPAVAQEATAAPAASPTVLPAAPLVLAPTTPPDWTLSGIFAHPRLSVGTLASRDGHSITPKRNDVAGADLTNQLFIVDLGSHDVRRLTRDDRNYFNPAWSPEGGRILCAASPKPGPLFGSEELDIELIDVRNGATQRLVQGSGIRSRPSWGPDGRQIAYFDSKHFVSRPSIQVARGDGTDARNMTAKLDRQVEDFAWAPDGRSILVTYQDGLSHALARIALAERGVHVIAPAGSSELPVEIGELAVGRGGALAWQQKDPLHASSIQLLASTAKQAVTLIDLEPQVQHWRLGVVKVIHWKNHRGEERDGALLEPPGYEPARRYPLIVDAYPLTGGADWTYPMAGNQAWASSGYLVFRPSPRAPHVWMNPWKSEASSSVAKGPQGWEVTLDDVMSGVDEVIRRGYADPDRMCLYGFSNGGGVVNYLVTRTTRFQCAVSVAGALSDWVRPALLNTGYDSLLSEWAGVSFGEHPDAYIQLSAVFHLSHVKTPMLLADGDNDGDFLLDTIEMYNGLRSAGVDVTLLRYPDQGHGFSGPALKDFWDREMAFFARYLRASR
jgi:dipeptidyl aminopeptidase/acylaminoacyl peptidase